jgi:predicted PurR-regulated permease PerM
VLVSYVHVTLTEAVVTSVVIGTAAAIAGQPIAFALGALVFLLGVIPIVGAILSGTVVVLVALVTKGTTQAIVLAIVVLVVQQLDANVLYPYLTHRRISMHPLVALLLVAAGGVVGGLFGAFFAVPLAAMAGAAYRSLVPSIDPSILEP